MIKLVVAYGQPENPEEFDSYYASTHVPITEKIPGLRRFDAGKVLGTPDGSEAPYYYLAELLFDDMEAFQSALGSPEGQAAAGDVPNFASGGVTMMIAEV